MAISLHALFSLVFFLPSVLFLGLENHRYTFSCTEWKTVSWRRKGTKWMPFFLCILGPVLTFGLYSSAISPLEDQLSLSTQGRLRFSWKPFSNWGVFSTRQGLPSFRGSAKSSFLDALLVQVLPSLRLLWHLQWTSMLDACSLLFNLSLPRFLSFPSTSL